MVEHVVRVKIKSPSFPSAEPGTRFKLLANSSPGTAEAKLERGANGSVLPSKFLLGDACEAPPRRGASSWAESLAGAG